MSKEVYILGGYQTDFARNWSKERKHFVAMIRELVTEHTEHAPARELGRLGPRQPVCAPGCCPAPPTRPQGGRPG